MIAIRQQLALKSSSAPTPLWPNRLQRKCACGNRAAAGGECGQCHDERMKRQRYDLGSVTEHRVIPLVVHEVLSSAGQKLDPVAQDFFEQRLDHDFSQVRVHADHRAAESAQAVGALAYTVGTHVVFGASRYVPQSTEGRRLLAHELTHVMQQGANGAAKHEAVAIGGPSDAAEQEAKEAAANVGKPGTRAMPAEFSTRASNVLRRQPTTGTQVIEEEYEEDKKNFEAARRLHQERLREIEERDRPHVFKTAGVTTTSRVDEQTAQLVQSALVESRLLRPYLRNKLGSDERHGQIQITDDRFVVHATLDDFAAAWATFTGRPAIVITDRLRQEAARIGGFYDRRARTIHLNPKATLGDAVHEALHKVSTRAVEGLFGHFLNEGVTQYFADQLLKEQGLPAATHHRYGLNLQCAGAFVQILGEHAVAEFQFAGKGGQKVRQAVIDHLGISGAELRRLVMKDQLCTRIMAGNVRGRQPTGRS